MTSPRSVCLVGLGTIARTHLAVLRAVLPEAELVGVDPLGTQAPAADLADRVHRSLEESLAAPHPDLWVLATPTHTHGSLAARLLTSTAGHVLTEKPLVGTRDDLAALEQAVPVAVLDERLRVAHHFGYSPEVRWAAAVATQEGLGEPRRIVSVFHDPYVGRAPDQLASYGSAWTDSGPNQLSMLLRWVDGLELTSVVDEGHRGHAAGVLPGGATVSLVASWRAADSSKRTVLSYADDVELWLDHTAVTGTLFRGGRPVRWRDDDGSTPRKVAHYRPLYDALVSGADDALLRYPAGRRVVELLAGPRPAPGREVTSAG